MLGPLAASRALATCLRFVVSTSMCTAQELAPACINDRADLDDCELYTYGPSKTQHQPQVTHWYAEVQEDIRSGSRTCLGAYVTVMAWWECPPGKNIDGNMNRRYALLSSAGWIPTMGVLKSLLGVTLRCHMVK